MENDVERVMTAWTTLCEAALDLAKRIIPGESDPTLITVVDAAVRRGLIESSETPATLALADSVERLRTNDVELTAPLADSMLRTIDHLRRLITTLAYD